MPEPVVKSAEPAMSVATVPKKEELFAKPGESKIDVKPADAKPNIAALDEAKTEVKSNVAKKTAVATDGTAPEPMSAQSPKSKKKERAARSKENRSNESYAQRESSEPESRDSVLVRDTYSSPDGRRVSVIRRVSRDDRSSRSDNDDEPVVGQDAAFDRTRSTRTE